MGWPRWRFLTGADTRSYPDGRFPVGKIVRAIIANILAPVRRCKPAGRAGPGASGRRRRSRGNSRLLVEGLLGNAKCVHRRRHSAVEHHLRDDFRDFFLGNSDMQRPGDMPFYHLRAVSQHDQGSNCAEAPGLQVYGGAVVYLAIDHRIHQTHHFRSQFRHSRRRLRIIIRPVVPHAELDCRLVQVGY